MESSPEKRSRRREKAERFLKTRRIVPIVADVVSKPPPVPLLGRIALHLKLITIDQLAEATHRQAKDGSERRLGDILVDDGFISRAQLQQILRAREQLIAKHRAHQALAAADATPETASTAGPATRPQAPPPRSRAGVGTTPREMDAEPLISLLRQGVERNASDVHIHSGTPLRMRLNGRFEVVGENPIPAEEAERLIRSALTPEQRALFDEDGELGLAYNVLNLGRFRVNVFRQQWGVDGVFRCIPPNPPTLGDLRVPSTLARFTNFHQGPVLVTGPANCGKSSTLAALVNIINEERREHILTIEDPIEYLHPSKRCVVNQRSVGSHTGSFARALRTALREDPDVIVIGELRDLETISLALTAAETGHLVLGTLHTNSAIRTLNRIIGVFPADQQDQIRSMVSESLRAVISQRLVPTADGSRRVPTLEVLVANKATGNLIRENKTFQIHSILQTGASQGMCLLDESLNRLVGEGLITRDEAATWGVEPAIPRPSGRISREPHPFYPFPRGSLQLLHYRTFP